MLIWLIIGIILLCQGYQADAKRQTYNRNKERAEREDAERERLNNSVWVFKHDNPYRNQKIFT